MEITGKIADQAMINLMQESHQKMMLAARHAHEAIIYQILSDAISKIKNRLPRGMRAYT